MRDLGEILHDSDGIFLLKLSPCSSLKFLVQLKASVAQDELSLETRVYKFVYLSYNPPLSSMTPE
jgi:hypothetical protein